jgi:hypothetical protein
MAEKIVFQQGGIEIDSTGEFQVEVPPAGSLAVEVKGAQGGPIAAAGLAVSGPLELGWSTGDDGRALIADLPSGKYSVTASASGFKSASADAEVAADQAQLALVLESAPSRLELTVRRRGAGPVAGVEVVVDGPSKAAGRTGTDGKLLFEDLEPGSYQLRARGDGFEEASATAEVKEGETASAALELGREQGSLKVRAVRLRGAPVEGARVSAVGVGGEGRASGLTDAGGEASFPALDTGDYNVTVSSAGSPDALVPATVSAGQERTVKAVLPAPRVKRFFGSPPGRKEEAASEIRLEAGSEVELGWEVEDATHVQISEAGEQGTDFPVVTVEAGPDGVNSTRLKPEKTTKFLAFAMVEGRLSPAEPALERAAPAAKALSDAAPTKPAPSAKPAVQVTVSAKRQLTVQVKTVFTLAGAPTQERWSGARKHNVVKDISVKIDGGAAVVGKGGKAVLDVASLAPGTHQLHIEPADPKHLAPDLAGPGLAKGDNTDPDVMFRAIDLQLFFDASGLKGVAPRTARPFPTNPRLMIPEHVLVLSTSPTELVLDWKPDWIKANAQFQEPPRVAKALVLHQTAGRIESDMELLAFGGVSAHYLVDVDGHAIKLVHERNASAHVGGTAKWMGMAGLPDISIGIEQVHIDQPGPQPWRPEQVARTAMLVDVIRAATGIRRQAVAGHGEVEPIADRKNAPNKAFTDPGPTFDWHALEDAGLVRTRSGAPPAGPIYGLTGAQRELPLKPGSRDSVAKGGPPGPVAQLQEDLRSIGYPFTDPVGVFGSDDFVTFPHHAATESAVKRFQLRFFTRVPAASRPRLGEVDFVTAQTIQQVLADSSATVTSVNVNPTTPQPPGAQPIRDELREQAAPDDQNPGGPGPRVEVRPIGPVVHDGDEVEISWSVEGEFDRLILEPPGIDVTEASRRQGKTTTGSTRVNVRRADAVNGAVSFAVNAFLASGVQKARDSGAERGAIIDALVASRRKLVELTPFILGTASPLHCIPARGDPKMTGTEFMRLVANVASAADRDKEALKQLKDGNIPDFLRHFVAVRVGDGTSQGAIFVAPDYLAIGTDLDFVRISLLPRGAQNAVDSCCCTLPTAKLCDDIFNGATTRIEKVAAFPNVADIKVQNKLLIDSHVNIEKALARAPGYQQGDLTTGPKKDIVLSLLLKRGADLKGKKIPGTNHVHFSQDSVVIYGWHDPKTSVAFQGEFDGHDNTYVDYSHGTRLVSETMIVDDGSGEKVMSIRDVRKDPKFRTLLCRPEELSNPKLGFAAVFPYPDSYR